MINFKIPAITKIVFSTTIDVRISDINYGNHLGHDALISILHEARMRLLKQNNYTELNIHGLVVLMKNLYVNYLGEAFYSDDLVINIGVNGFRKTSVDLLYDVSEKNSGKKIATALTTMIFFDYQQRKIAEIPNEFLALIS